MTQTSDLADWIAVDWGSTHLRAWAVGEAGVLAEALSRRGAASLSRDEFEPALLEITEGWLRRELTTTVVCCGMAGSRQGWAEAPYRRVPCPAAAPSSFTVAAARDPRLHVALVPGIMQDRPADIMRGEETQIAGFLALHPDFDGVLCLPGTHTKWVHVSAKEIVSFQTVMTGELFALLSGQSVLRHSVASQGWDADAFTEAVADGLSRPERASARLFSLRAEDILTGLDPVRARARLSGTLVGVELAATRPYWLGQRVAVIGSRELSAVYADALAGHGAEPERADAVETTLAGLAVAYAALRDGT